LISRFVRFGRLGLLGVSLGFACVVLMNLGFWFWYLFGWVGYFAGLLLFYCFVFSLLLFISGVLLWCVLGYCLLLWWVIVIVVWVFSICFGVWFGFDLFIIVLRNFCPLF